MKQKSFSLAERFRKVEEFYGVEFVEWDRTSTGILFSSGCGIGLGLMDTCPGLRWYVDVDNYRNKQIDWEAVAVILSAGEPEKICLAGWFSNDSPKVFDDIRQGVVTGVPIFEYRGGGNYLLENVIGFFR